jgi:hypothetical protein
MSERPRDSLLDRIHKLLQKTTANGATEKEAASALALAMRLMREHRIEMADIKGRGSAKWGADDGHTYTSEKSLPEYAWIGLILTEYFRVRCFTDASDPGEDGKRVYKIKIFGLQKDVEFGKWVFKFLLDSFQFSFRHYMIFSLVLGQDSEESFYKGMALGISETLKRERDRQRDEAARSTSCCHNELATLDDIHVDPKTGLALLHTDAIEKALEEFMQSNYENFSYHNFSHSEDSEAVSRGYQKGRTIRINKPLAAPDSPDIADEEIIPICDESRFKMQLDDLA